MIRSTAAGPSEMHARVAALDWSATPVGPVETWPQSLRATVRTLLASRYPMVLTWGPGFTQFYNDAYSRLIGDKHPAALGEDIRVTLAEGWDALEPLIRGAMETGEATWVPALFLPLETSPSPSPRGSCWRGWAPTWSWCGCAPWPPAASASCTPSGR